MGRTLSRRAVLRPERLIWILLLVLLAERLLLFRQFGLSYFSYSDDTAYIESGRRFTETGIISMWGPYPSAMIMPGMPVLIGVFARLFGEGSVFYLALRLLWILMGVATAYVVYRTAVLIAGGWAGLLAASGFLLPNMAWMNHVILTETPYLLLFSLCLYLTFQMGRRDRRGDRIGYLLGFTAALMIRSNILLLLPFTALWLLLKRRGVPLRRLLLSLGCLLLLLLTPWTIRNYRLFDAFIPLTYGAGNPLLLGTYQGEGFPADEELDYGSGVDAVMRERYGAYYRDEAVPWAEDELDEYRKLFDPEGEISEERLAQYLRLEADGLKARYRLREWWRRGPGSLLKSYLYIKPRWMLNWAWAWESAFGVPYAVLHRIFQLNFLLCGLALLLALLLKRCRAPLFFLGALYWVSVYLYSLAFVSDRYSSVFTGLRFTIAGVGLSLLPEAFRRLRRRRGSGVPTS